MARAADWFANLSKKAQAEYIKAHPNSKYAKGAKAAKAPAAKPTSVAARVADTAKKYTNTANALIKKAKEKMEAAKTPATKAKWKAEVARLAVIKKDLKTLGAKGKGISVTLKGGTIESVSGLGRKTSTTRKLQTKAANKQSPAVKAKAHEAKRVADKNKVVAKTPSAKTASMPKTMAKVIDQRKARIKSGATSLLKSATASLAEAKIKVKEAKTIKAKETAQRRVDSIKAKIAKLKAAAK